MQHQKFGNGRGIRECKKLNSYCSSLYLAFTIDRPEAICYKAQLQKENADQNKVSERGCSIGQDCASSGKKAVMWNSQGFGKVPQALDLTNGTLHGDSETAWNLHILVQHIDNNPGK